MAELWSFVPKSPRDGLLVLRVILPTHWPQVDLLLAMGSWSCWLPFGLAVPQSDWFWWGGLVSPAGRGRLLYSLWFPGPGTFTSTSLTSTNSLAQDWAADIPRPLSSGGCAPGALIPLVRLFTTVLMLARFALGLWIKDESRAQCHGLSGSHEERELKEATKVTQSFPELPSC